MGATPPRDGLGRRRATGARHLRRSGRRRAAARGDGRDRRRDHDRPAVVPTISEVWLRLLESYWQRCGATAAAVSGLTLPGRCAAPAGLRGAFVDGRAPQTRVWGEAPTVVS